MRTRACRRKLVIALPKLNVEQLRTLWHRVGKTLRLHYWFPHIPLAVLMALGGIWLLRADVGKNWQHYFTQIVDGSLSMPPRTPHNWRCCCSASRTRRHTRLVRLRSSSRAEDSRYWSGSTSHKRAGARE